MDNAGNVYVADQFNNRVQKFRDSCFVPPPVPRASLSDPIACTGDNITLTAHAEVANPNATATIFNFTAALPAQLTGLVGSCVASGGTCTVSNNQVVVTGTLAANQTITIDYKVRVVTGTAPGTNLCITATALYDFDRNGVFDAQTMVQACTALNCPPPIANVRVSDQRAGSVLVFPYYVSQAATQKDTRLTISNRLFVNGRESPQYLVLLRSECFAAVQV